MSPGVVTPHPNFNAAGPKSFPFIFASAPLPESAVAPAALRQGGRGRGVDISKSLEDLWRAFLSSTNIFPFIFVRDGRL